MEEDVTLRNSGAVRQRRSNIVRTPTAVVSEVFGFLNDDPSARDDDDLTMSDGEVDQLFSNLDIGMAGIDEANCVTGSLLQNGCDGVDHANIEDCVTGGLLLNGCDSDKYLAEFKSKDSGFASLERQRCEPSSLFDSFLENDDDTEDALESVCSNDIVRSISESLYDDVDVSTVPRSISMDAKSTCVDDETENAIASSAEKFGVGSVNSAQGSESVAVSKAPAGHSGDVNDKLSITSNGGGNITIVMVNKQSVGDEEVSPHEVSPAELHVSGSSVSPMDISGTRTDSGNIEEDKTCAVAICGGIEASPVDHKPELDNVFDFVIEPDNAGYDSAFAQRSVMDSYCYGADGVSSGGGLFDYEVQESGPPAGESCDVDAAGDTGNDSLNVAAVVYSVSSDDGDEEDLDARESDYTAGAGDQAYDTIDMESHVVGAANDTVQAEEVGLQNLLLNHSSEELVAEDSFSDSQNSTTPLSEQSPFNVTRRHKLEKNPSAELASDDSSDEDVGIYAESFRRSNWVRLSQQGNIETKVPELSPPQSRSSASTLLVLAADNIGSSCTDNKGSGNSTDHVDADEVFTDPFSQAAALAKKMHRRTDSMTTTASENEFKFQYVSRRKCLIQRADSQQEYHRLSSRVYDQDKQVVVHRSSDSEDLGLHLLNSHPAFITSIDPGSAADKAGLTEGQILVSVNDQNVLTTDHADIVQMIQSLKGSIKLSVANSDFQPVRDLQATVMSGFMYKLGNSAFKIWKKRFFVLRQDNCLYYYKNDQEHDPLGALPLGGYTISRHTETSKDFCFKAEKYGGRTYYFIADNRTQMTEWVGALTEAAARSKKRKESFLSVSSHNVGLPALHILKPECAGFLGKLNPNQRSWRRRYCVLKDACVYYYKDKNSVSALGVAHLHGYTVDVENFQRRKFSFSLQPPEKKMRVFYLSADNETDKKRWVESLIHSIQRWVRVDKEAEC